MEMEENTINIIVLYDYQEYTFILSEYAAIEDLKLEIYKETSVKPSKQFLNGWTIEPKNDDLLICNCVDVNEDIYLILNDKNIFQNEPSIPDQSAFSDVTDTMELAACRSFKTTYSNNFDTWWIDFQECTLDNFILEIENRPLSDKKMGILYFHNTGNKFSTNFCQVLKNSNAKQYLEHYLILGWDISNEKYHDALIKALNKVPQLSEVSGLIKSKVAGALILLPIQGSLTILSWLKGDVSEKKIISALQEYCGILKDETAQENNLMELEQCTNEDDIGSNEYQLLMADRLGDRDYDRFEFDQYNELKSKIGFSLYGPPKDEITLDYKKKETDNIEKIFKVILEESNLISQWKDTVEVSFITNCTEPLPSEKSARAKKYANYNPKTDICPYPVYVLRKCHGSDNPCRVFVDDSCRVYDSWDKYITKNKLGECSMILPTNGRYGVNNNNEVLLERHLSPACGIDVKILKAADIGSMVGGIASGGIFALAAIPAITVAPAALLVGGAVGLGVGIYSIGRSIYTIVDRNKHKESMSFANSEARGAYLNIVAGSLGFVGAGASMAVSQLASQGVNLGLGARMALNSINIANITAGGISLGNSAYDVLNQWIYEDQTPSMLTLVQLSSSILFFGNAVYNFRTAGVIIEETQAKTIQDINESLRSNRHRKTFNKLLKSTIADNNGDVVKGRAEVISTIRNFQNRDEVFAVLTRSNKIMNEKGVKITASNGKVSLNGIAVDIDNFSGFTKRDMNKVFSDLKSYKSVSNPQEAAILKGSISSYLFSNPDTYINIICKLLNGYNTDFKVYILQAINLLLGKLQYKILMQIKSILGIRFESQLFDMVMQFFMNQATELEVLYKKWNATKNPAYYHEVFNYIKVDTAKSIINAISCVLRRDFINNEMTQDALKRLIDFGYQWCTKVIYEAELEQECESKRRVHSARRRVVKVSCSLCGGFYYKPDK